MKAHEATSSCSEERDSQARFNVLRTELGLLYEELDQEVAAAGPACALSGRCCRFREYDHTLFLSAPEALILIADAPPPTRGLDDGDGCPWQDLQGRCTARNARPLGCRVYFCDPTFAGRMPELSEAYLSRIKQLAIRHQLPWNYAPLHQHLRAAQQAGRWTGPEDLPEIAPAKPEPAG